MNAIYPMDQTLLGLEKPLILTMTLSQGQTGKSVDEHFKALHHL